MKPQTYSKEHSDPAIAKKHARKIKKRGGVVSQKKTANGVTLIYSFPEK